MPSLNYYSVQKAIYERLTGDSQLMSIVSGIFDNVPQDQQFPFITIGNTSSSEIANLGGDGTEQRININIWSREAGHKQVGDIMDIVYKLLHNSTLFISGKNIVAIRFISNAIQLEDDGWTYHGSMNLLVIVMDS